VRTVSVSKIEVEIGYSLIQFEYNPEATPYHIAFHISAKKENEALKWLKKRIPILKMGDCEIVYFSDWNAKSLYFYDADHNIMEFISRRHLHKSATEAFSENDICGIAEIGLATQNVKNVYDKVHQEIGLEKYSGDFEKFCPIGDDLGLLITIDNQQKKTWFPTTDKAENSEFSLKFSHQHKNKKLHFDGEDVSFT
jgi:catechol-2,3-dioxygenase